MDGRIAVRDLATLPQATPVRVAGRVVAVAEQSVALQDDTGRVDVLVAERLALGVLVDVIGHWDGARVCARAVHTSGIANERFAAGDSDFTFLTGKRMHNLRLRHAVTRGLRAHLDERGLLEVETPAMVPCPGLDVHLDAIEVLGMRAPRWLHTSPEYQMKRLLTTSVPGVYQLGKAFRRGERGTLHEPEFTMLEWYRTFASADDLMRDTEALVADVAQRVLGTTHVPGIAHAVDVVAPWERLRVADAFERYAGISLESVVHDDDRYYRTLAEQIEPNLGRERPVFLTHYPARMASLARLCEDDPRYAERFEAYVDGVELCNGFGELTDPVEQRARLERDRAERSKLGRSVYPLDERFLSALQEGIPPSAGNALGVDRLVMLLAGAKHIDEVLAFPCARV
jgi:elongation factor P--(R)-beta-lysine ligase